MVMPNSDVLIVEDEQIVALDLKARVEDLGHRVVEMVDQADDALEATRRTHPHLVLMDIRTPGKIDGIEAARLIVEDSDTPVVFVTAHSDDETIAKAVAVGPYGYLVKPVLDRDLYATIEVVLVKASLWREINESRQNLQLRVRELDALNQLFQVHLRQRFNLTDTFESVVHDLGQANQQLCTALQTAEGVGLLGGVTATDPEFKAANAFQRLVHQVKQVADLVSAAHQRANDVTMPDDEEVRKVMD